MPPPASLNRGLIVIQPHALHAHQPRGDAGEALGHHVFFHQFVVFPEIGRLQESAAVGIAVFERARLFVALLDRLHDGVVIRRDILGRQHVSEQDMPIPLIGGGLRVSDRVIGIQDHGMALAALAFSAPSVSLW